MITKFRNEGEALSGALERTQEDPNAQRVVLAERDVRLEQYAADKVIIERFRSEVAQLTVGSARLRAELEFNVGKLCRFGQENANLVARAANLDRERHAFLSSAG